MKLVIIDDEPFHVKEHVAALSNEGWTVTQFDGVDSFYSEFQANPTEFDLIVIDILMPDGKLIQSSTGTGEDTGIHLIKRILEVQAVSRRVPVAVLSQMDVQEIADVIQAMNKSHRREFFRVWSKATASVRLAREITIWFNEVYVAKGCDIIKEGWDFLSVDQRWELLKKFAEYQGEKPSRASRLN